MRKTLSITSLLMILMLMLPNLWGFTAADLIKRYSGLKEAIEDLTAISDEEENKIGNELKKILLEENTLTTTRKFDIRGIFNRIKSHALRKKIKYECFVLKDDVFNAYAIAGGKIFLNTGLINRLSSEDEIAFVIAHEIAHVELKHCIKTIQYTAKARQINPRLGEVVAIAYGLYRRAFSKQQEREADEFGVRLMMKAGYKKSGAVSFFRILEKYEPQHADPTLQTYNDFISSHPTARDRRERIEKMN